MSYTNIPAALETIKSTFRAAFNGDFWARCALNGCVCLLFGPYVLWPLMYPDAGVYFADDAYYYLLPASQFWNEFRFTFDGVSETNGYHPLWMLLLVIAALPLKILGLSLWLPWIARVYALIALLISANAIYSIFRYAGTGRILPIAAFSLALIVTLDMQASGLEVSLLLATVATFCLHLTRICTSGEPVNSLALGFFSLLVLLTRLDMGIFLICTFICLVPRLGLLSVVKSGLALTLMTLPYLVYNYTVYGHLMPISGRVKHLWANLKELETFGREYNMLDLFETSAWQNKMFRNLFVDHLPLDLHKVLEKASLGYGPELATVKSLFPYILMGSVALLVGSFVWAIARGRQSRAIAIALLGLLLFSHVLTIGYYCVNSDTVWEWYKTLGLACITVGLVALFGMFLPSKLTAIGAAALLITHVSISAWLSIVDLNKRADGPWGLRETYVTLGQWLRHNTPANARIGSWAAGEIGWEARRHVFNLEGLAGDTAMLEANIRFDMISYMAEKDITYLANFWREKYAPLPTLLLQPHDLAFWQRRGLIGYFWALRLRPILDYPEAFRLIFHHDAKDQARTQGYVLSADPEMLDSFVAARSNWLAQASAVGNFFPAESMEIIGKGKKKANIGRTLGMHVEARNINAVFPGVDAQADVYARALNPYSETLDLGDGNVLPVDSGWQWVFLGKLSATGEQTTLQIRAAKDAIIDEFLVVPVAKEQALQNLSADWLPQ